MLTFTRPMVPAALDRSLRVEPGDEAAAAAGQNVDLSVLDRIAAQVTVALALGLGAQVQLDRQVVDAGNAEDVRAVGGVGVGGRARRHDARAWSPILSRCPAAVFVHTAAPAPATRTQRAAVSSEDRPGGGRTARNPTGGVRAGERAVPNVLRIRRRHAPPVYPGRALNRAGGRWNI